jgi:hypothetical protein
MQGMEGNGLQAGEKETMFHTSLLPDIPGGKRREKIVILRISL